MGSMMFNLYPQPDDYIPNNMPRCRREDKLVIMTGETAVHSFEIPFDASRWCSEVQVIYKYKLDNIITKVNNDLEKELEIIDDECRPHCSIVTCTLEPEDTKLFDDTFLSAQVQLRFVMRAPVDDEEAKKIFDLKYHDEDVVFTEIYPIKVINSLEES